MEQIIHDRGLKVEDVKTRTVIDTGDNSLKVCVSIYDGNMDPEVSFKAQECSKERLTGVNCLIVLAEIEGG